MSKGTQTIEIKEVATIETTKQNEVLNAIVEPTIKVETPSEVLNAIVEPTIKVETPSEVLNAIVELTEVVTTKKSTNVIDFKSTQSFNKAFKQDINSLGKVRSDILTFNESLPINEKLNPLLVSLLEKMKVQENYEFVKANFEANSKGMYSSYRLLMYFRKNLTELQNKFK
jgi:hypothetical protein